MLDITSFKKASLIALSIILLGWTLESLVMVVVFGEDNVIEQFVSPSAHEIWTRIPPAVLTIVLVFTIRYFVIRQNKTTARLETVLSKTKALSGLLPICAWWVKPMTPVRGLFISWAIPAAISPTEAKRLDT